MPRILDGVAIRDQILAEAKPRVDHLIRTRRAPGLAVVLVGENPASQIYVRNKIKACETLGIHSEKYTPPATVTTGELLALIEMLNAKPEIDGILVQMPLPPQVDSARVLHAVAAGKDADGFHPYNVGQLVANAPAPRACTPAGVMELLRRYAVPTTGAKAVVVGRSDIVGKPMALLLLHAHATVTICHSKTRHLPRECRQADILVAALGRPAFLTADYIGENTTVIDVGINAITDPEQAQAIFGRDAARMETFARRGTATIGDAHPLDVAERAAAYTPVPGGVGPLTIAMLMMNTIALAERRLA